MTLGQHLTYLRTGRGWSQDVLAEQLGVSRQSVSKWETDSSVPDLDKLLGLSELFGVTLDELVKGNPLGAQTRRTDLHLWRRRLGTYPPVRQREAAKRLFTRRRSLRGEKRMNEAQRPRSGTRPGL